MEERTDPRIGCSRRGGKRSNTHRFAVFLRLQGDSASARNLVRQGTQSSASGNPLPLGTATNGVGTSTHWYSTIKPSSSTSTSPRLVQTLLPVALATATNGVGTATHWYSTIKPSSSTSTSPRLVQTLLPVTL